MPRISAEREEATRRRILKAARHVFVEKGFHRASIDDVVAACGLSVGAIYTYFPNKEELIRASILAANKEESEAILADTQAGGSMWERFDRAIGGWWRYTIEAPGAPAFLAEAWGEASRSPVVREFMALRYERGLTVIAIMLRDCVGRGELAADLDVDALARTLGALLDGMVIEHVTTGGLLRRVDAQRRVRLVMEAAGSSAAA
jgi:TetR/AcrR family transcriptional regulator, transcriptional repressor of aconitase